MTNNDILQKISAAFNLNADIMTAIYNLTEQKTTVNLIQKWLKKDNDEGYEECSDENLAAFLNGFIIEKRGKKDGPQPMPEKVLNNNNIFMKLKIALDLKAEDVMEIMDLAKHPINKHVLSAFFRKPGNKHYKKCKDQILTKFLEGVQLKYRPNK